MTNAPLFSLPPVAACFPKLSANALNSLSVTLKTSMSTSVPLAFAALKGGNIFSIDMSGLPKLSAFAPHIKMPTAKTADKIYTS
jgi:hypothetical protein